MIRRIMKPSVGLTEIDDEKSTSNIYERRLVNINEQLEAFVDSICHSLNTVKSSSARPGSAAPKPQTTFLKQSPRSLSQPRRKAGSS